MAGVATTLSRRTALDLRAAAQQLDRAVTQPDALAVLDLGIQEAMGHPAGYALAARLPLDADVGTGALPVGPGQPYALCWSLRGAPHVHRRAATQALAAALWPMSEADAAMRLNETGPSVARAGMAASEQFALAAATMRRVVPRATAKGAASTAASAALPAAMLRDCRPCGATHLSDSAMRATSLPAGLELEPGTAPPVLVRRRGARTVDDVDDGELARLATRTLDLLGAVAPGDVADVLGVRAADLSRRWPAPGDGIEPVSVEGRRALISPAGRERLAGLPRPAGVRLLGAFDPYLPTRNRELFVPDTAARKALWPVLGRPGVLFVDGEIIGLWRARSARAALTLTVESFAPLPASAWSGVQTEAERIAAVRGAAAVTVVRRG